MQRKSRWSAIRLTGRHATQLARLFSGDDPQAPTHPKCVVHDERLREACKAQP